MQPWQVKQFGTCYFKAEKFLWDIRQKAFRTTCRQLFFSWLARRPAGASACWRLLVRILKGTQIIWRISHPKGWDAWVASTLQSVCGLLVHEMHLFFSKREQQQAALRRSPELKKFGPSHKFYDPQRSVFVTFFYSPPSRHFEKSQPVTKFKS